MSAEFVTPPLIRLRNAFNSTGCPPRVCRLQPEPEHQTGVRAGVLDRDDTFIVGALGGRASLRFRIRSPNRRQAEMYQKAGVGPKGFAAGGGARYEQEIATLGRIEMRQAVRAH